MTFQLSLDEWMEAQYLHSRSQSPLRQFMPFCNVFFVVIMTPGFIATPDLTSISLWVFVIALSLYTWIGIPYRLKAQFRRKYNGELMPPVTYEFSDKGFIFRSHLTEGQFWWEHFEGRLEGTNVWVLVLNIDRTHLLTLPKRVTESEENKQEWEIVNRVFASQQAPLSAH